MIFEAVFASFPALARARYRRPAGVVTKVRIHDAEHCNFVTVVVENALKYHSTDVIFPVLSYLCCSQWTIFANGAWM